ncbi:MAG: hypothetical protein GX235_00655 [Clostridiales bacterium]|nr:hypothetical protein [Clostridiales bacterium]
MEYIVFALTIFAFIVLIMFKGFLDEKKKKADFVVWLRNNYGALPKRAEDKPEEFERISHYFKKHEADGFYIDDITWNDLNMDSIFKQMNYAYSAAGEEYLYYLLRTPIQDTDKIERLEKHISFFMENEEARIKYQLFFAELGRTGKNSIYDYLNYLNLLGNRDNKKHYIGDLAILVSIIIMFFSVPLGVILLVLSICRNIISYFKVKNEIEPYITSFGYILRLLRSVENIVKLPAEGFAEEMEELRDCRKKMSKFKSGSYIIMSPARMSAASNPLEVLLDYIRMTFHLDLIKFNDMLAEVRKNIDVIDRMLTLIGYIETTIAIGAYRISRDVYCLPELNHYEGLQIDNMYHPLIENPVKNSISANQGILLTGSNASGKSTFLKTVALNAILAQTIHTCLADRYAASPYRIMSSMALRDDLSGGDSYYIVEIKSLKRILNNVIEGGNKVLCFVDEVLRGTNTVERIAASTQILKSLANTNVICFAATHDIELTHLLQSDYDNYHFEEEIKGDDVVFNYRLMIGRATTRNAIKLLRVMGYEEQIIHKAEELAESFMKNGVWTEAE